MAVQAGTITPFGIQLNTIGRISDHQARLAVALEPCDSFRAGRIATEHPMRPKQPEIAESRHGRFGKRRSGVCLFLVIQRQQIIDLAGVEPR